MAAPSFYINCKSKLKSTEEQLQYSKKLKKLVASFCINNGQFNLAIKFMANVLLVTHY